MSKIVVYVSSNCVYVVHVMIASLNCQVEKSVLTNLLRYIIAQQAELIGYNSARNHDRNSNHNYFSKKFLPHDVFSKVGKRHKVTN